MPRPESPRSDRVVDEAEAPTLGVDADDAPTTLDKASLDDHATTIDADAVEGEAETVDQTVPADRPTAAPAEDEPETLDATTPPRDATPTDTTHADPADATSGGDEAETLDQAPLPPAAALSTPASPQDPAGPAARDGDGQATVDGLAEPTPQAQDAEATPRSLHRRAARLLAAARRSETDSTAGEPEPSDAHHGLLHTPSLGRIRQRLRDGLSAISHLHSGSFRRRRGDEVEAAITAVDIEDEPATADVESPSEAFSDPMADGVKIEHDGPYSPGTRIGNYTVARKIGQGGFGMVLEAEQENPKRRVALKVIHAAGLTRQVLRRFSFEAQVLGQLQHPGIAQVYEAGVFDTPAGRQPFFAMELIDGRPLHHHVRAHRPTLGQKLELLIRICDAVQHAHARGVVHRDLKPANILIDEQGHPKVLDFGVARVTDADLPSVTFQTDIGQLVGTVPYMSPEQARGDPTQLDTRSDVYALGVVAYELLVGQLPYSIKGKMVHEAIRVIQDDAPTPMRSLDRSLKGDLETVIGKALEKDKARRYQTASELANDVRRFLDREPIAARPPSAGYALRMFAAKNKGLVAGGLAAALLLAATAVVTTGLYVRAERARAEAVRQREIASAINDFLNGGVIAQADPGRDRGAGTTILDAVLKAEAEIEPRFAGFPDQELAVRRTIATVYRRLNRLTRARDNLVRCLDLAATRAAAPGELAGEALAVTDALAAVRRALGEHDEALALWEAVAERRAATLGPDDPATLECENNIAVVVRDLGRYAEAEQRFRDVLARAAGAGVGASPVALSARANLASLWIELGRFDDAASALQGVYDVRLAQRGGQEHPEVMQTLHDIAWLEFRRGRVEQAAAALERVVELKTRVLGATHPDTLHAVADHAHATARLGRGTQAASRLAETLGRARVALGEDHPRTLEIAQRLAAVHLKLGRYDRAIALLRETLDLVAARLGPEHPLGESLAVELAVAHYGLGRYDDAYALLEVVLRRGPGLPGDAPRDAASVRLTPLQLKALNVMGSLLWVTGHWQRALPVRSEVLAQTEAVFGPTHRAALLASNNLGLLLSDMALHGRATQRLERAAELAHRRLASDNPERWLIQNTLALALTRGGQASRAVPLLNEALPAMRDALGDRHPMVWTMQATLAEARLGIGDADGALKLIEAPLTARASALGEEHADTLRAQHVKALAMFARGERFAAVALAQSTLDKRRAALGERHPEAARSAHDTATMYLALDRGRSAARLFRDAAETRLSRLGVENADTQSSIRALVDVAQRLGMDELVDEWAPRMIEPGPRRQDPGVGQSA